MFTKTIMLYNSGISSEYSLLLAVRVLSAVLSTTNKKRMSDPKPTRIRNTAVLSIQMLYLTAAMRVKMLKHKKTIETNDKSTTSIELEIMNMIDIMITARR
jgi:hypothetical protein